jgi:phosphohistidine phosphatase
MSQELWFLRHGDAEPGDGKPDAERRLTDKGERQARVAGGALARLEVQFSLVLTSPRVRAVDTARLACEPLGAEPVPHEPLSGEFDRDDALTVLAGQDDGARVMVVGHEPDFSQTVHDLTGGRIDLKKGGIAVVSIDGGRGELIALMRPRELDALAG